MRYFVALHFWLFSFLLLGQEVEILPDAATALGKRFHMIRDAKAGETIKLSTFIFANDDVGRLTTLELAKALERGVKVEILFDAMGSSMIKPTEPYLKLLATLGAEVRWANPLTANFLNFNRRMHDKIMLIEGKHAIVGGRNLWEHSYAISKKPQLDMEIIVNHDTTMNQILEYWRERWQHYTTRPFTQKMGESEVRTMMQTLQSTYDAFTRTDYFARFQRAVEPPRFAKVDFLRFVSDNRWKRYLNVPQIFKSWQTWDHIEEMELLIESAKTEILIESPWVVLTKRMKKVLRAARERGVTVKILTNSETSSESSYRYHVSRANSAPFAEKHGIEMYEYPSDSSLHSKFIVIDGKTVYIGSFNLGPRSERLNSETGVIFESSERAQEVRQELLDRISRSRLSPPYSWLQNPCMHIFGGVIGSQM